MLPRISRVLAPAAEVFPGPAEVRAGVAPALRPMLCGPVVRVVVAGTSARRADVINLEHACRRERLAFGDDAQPAKCRIRIPGCPSRNGFEDKAAQACGLDC